jgi:hypothetical protein
MFTVKNTLAGALMSAAWVVWLMVAPLWDDSRFSVMAGPFAAWGAMMHVWFLLAHLRLKDRARHGQPAVWPVVPSN